MQIVWHCDSYKEGRTWSDLQSDVEVSGQRSSRCGVSGLASLEIRSLVCATQRISTTTSSTRLVHRDAAQLAADGQYAIAARLADVMRGPQESSEPAMLRDVLTKLVMVLDQQNTETASTTGGPAFQY
ncbi:hypothetical protein AMELA_G00048630 [Ameiurus melas]|uniref:Uncharacterized protein n=1 Tax=Ameiurus melas TaxID=219545 RepID=A0A7J6B6Z7_AMEME|nr:hypothetical protein AMELA_G00048630 [Ameiurus melas]